MATRELSFPKPLSGLRETRKEGGDRKGGEDKGGKEEGKEGRYKFVNPYHCKICAADGVFFSHRFAGVNARKHIRFSR